MCAINVWRSKNKTLNMSEDCFRLVDEHKIDLGRGKAEEQARKKEERGLIGPWRVTVESVTVQVHSSAKKGQKEEHSLDAFTFSAMLTSFWIFSFLHLICPDMRTAACAKPQSNFVITSH